MTTISLVCSCRLATIRWTQLTPCLSMADAERALCDEPHSSSNQRTALELVSSRVRDSIGSTRLAATRSRRARPDTPRATRLKNSTKDNTIRLTIVAASCPCCNRCSCLPRDRGIVKTIVTQRAEPHLASPPQDRKQIVCASGQQTLLDETRRATRSIDAQQATSRRLPKVDEFEDRDTHPRTRARDT